MLHQPRSGKLFQLILTILVLGLTSACESETSRHALLKDAETKALKSEQRAVAAEARMKELTGKVQVAEKARVAATEARQVAEKNLDKAKGDVAFHTVLNVIFFGLIIAAFFAGLRQGERRGRRIMIPPANHCLTTRTSKCMPEPPMPITTSRRVTVHD